MASSYRNSMGSVVEDYTQLNTIPALLSVAFVAAGLYQFGGISDITLTWISYTLTAQHATFVSLGVYVVAFMSSETRDFAYYEQWEQVLIAAGPLLIVGYQYVPQIADIVNTTSNLGPIAAFLVTVAAWGVAVR
ncbi:VP4 [Halorubrum pleomorphic virus 2]|uniref:VP4 n=1 Tax=Halorubrum pleomorphic virus 2 TaxID=1156719 RepID=H9ABL8_9VIRU|nr:VP4 [Halorubrum pleomorphic virus 2]AFD03988.1 VP4 [Halorubrum pleomorphic virus 2]